MPRKICIKILISLLIVSYLMPAWSDSHNKSYSFAVVPQQSAKRLAKLWAPVLAYVSQQSGVILRFKTAKNIPEFEKRLALGDYDFAYMNPYHFTVFNRDPGYRALAVRKNQPIRGIIVAHKDSSIQTLEELANKKLAFPSPAAFAASILPRAYMTQQEIPFSAKYVSSHDSVYLAVSKGFFPVGGGVKRTFNNTNPEVKKQLRILWTSEAYTPHAIAVHPEITNDVFQRVQQVFINMAKNPQGKALLLSLKIKHGLVSAKDSDWDDIRDLNIDLLD